MAELHDALRALSPLQWSDLSEADYSHLLSEAFTSGELIINSVPQLADGTSFSESQPHHDKPNTAASHKEIHASVVRSQAPDESHEKLQKSWGKPVKVSASKNPLGASIWKTAGNDRHGAWWARRSIHEGISFDKFKKAMQLEMPKSVTIIGGPGAGAVRGIGGDQRLEKVDVEDTGRLEVYQLSAQFPGPTTPREFISLILTSEDALSEKSASVKSDGSKHVPKHFIVVSRPLQHPDAPERSGYVRGQYESVEMIREIPLHTSTEKGSGDPELNPVEWIMVTRSDPGGGIPRFLVDRGTPDAMVGDLSKFLDWACALDEVENPDELLKRHAVSAPATSTSDAAADGAAEANGSLNNRREVPTTKSTTVEQPAQTGVLSTIGSTLEAYAPAVITDKYHAYVSPGTKDQAYDSDSDETVSSDSFESADENLHTPRAHGSRTPSKTSPSGYDTTDSISLASNSSELKDKKDMTRHEKELLKLVQTREKLEAKVAKKREEEEARLQKTVAKDQEDEEKARERLEREVQKMEEKHKQQLEKLEQKREREIKKAESRRQKKDDASRLSAVSRERDDFRSQAELYKDENRVLHERVAELEAENAAMVQRLAEQSQGTGAVSTSTAEVAK